MKLFAGITIAAALAANPAFAQDLWRGALAGMTPAEVVGAFPEARATDPARPAIRFELPGLNLIGLPWKAAFHFTQDDRLRAVILSPADEASVGSGQTAFAQLRRDLIVKYGDPLVCDESGVRGVVATSTCDWLAGPVAIKLKRDDFGDKAYLSVAYTAEEAGGSIL
ncbi:MAG TPA: hypothetical protein VFF48_10510 [Brevundimonas sp.]|nr:hypothetical protein [Brevundimonas sp.]